MSGPGEQLWFAKVAGQDVGPVPESELLELLRTNLRAGAVRRQGAVEWLDAWDLPAFASAKKEAWKPYRGLLIAGAIAPFVGFAALLWLWRDRLDWW